MKSSEPEQQQQQEAANHGPVPESAGSKEGKSSSPSPDKTPPRSTQQSQNKKPGIAERLSQFPAWIERSGSAWWGRQGARCATYPKTHIAGVFLFFLVMLPGWLLIETETKGDRLWASQTSRPALMRDWTSANFPTAPKFFQLMIVRKNALKEKNYRMKFGKDLVNLSFKLNELIMKVETEKDVYDVTSGLKYEDVCFKDGAGRCLRSGLPRMWGFSKETYENEVSTDLDVVKKFATTKFWPGTLLSLNPSDWIHGYPADIEAKAASGEEVFVKMVVQQYPYVYGKDEKANEATGWNWDRGAVKALKNFNDPNYDVYMIGEKSLDDEVERVVEGDTTLNAMCYTIMFTFCVLWISRIPRYHIAQRWLKGKEQDGYTAAAGEKQKLQPYSKLRHLFVAYRGCAGWFSILLVVMATLAGYGFCMYCGVKFSTIHLVLPFIIVGIAVDDVFIIVNAFDAFEGQELTVAEKAQRAMTQVGMSITLTSTTDLAVFLLGLTTSYPAVQYFCAYAAVTVT